MLGERTKQQDRKKTYLNIKDGAIVKRTPDGEEKYGYVEGRIERLFTKERNFRGEVVTYWYLDLRDVDSGELYSLGFSYASNTFKSIILQVASENGLQGLKNGSTMKIEPYTKNGYDKVQVWTGGSKLDWAVRILPPVESRKIGGRVIKDDSARMSLICNLAEKVSKSLAARTGATDTRQQRNDTGTLDLFAQVRD